VVAVRLVGNKGRATVEFFEKIDMAESGNWGHISTFSILSMPNVACLTVTPMALMVRFKM
jgi:hypothetical protein